MDRRDLLGVLGLSAAGLAAGLPDREAGGATEPHGKTPVDECGLYLCAFHIAKKDPKFQVEAHHYCSAVNDEVHQCIIFDSAGKGARILGVEYIISDRLYRSLPDVGRSTTIPIPMRSSRGCSSRRGWPRGRSTS